ncbi:FG-GAP repeat protein [Nitrosomonas ureae]|uniref:FG-GAP repeat protein n=1 Tax=Nitrosomonas ureae TaxID=44577 RepID=UPI000D764CD4|nr:FG-GAP repeat protein [Nitrosomonas ureae]PXX16586.1 FG-GAP repeat protein [Nitrosomonas ureae]
MATFSINLSSLDGINGFRLDGVTAGDLLGRSVSTAGDVNGDGFDDVIVGARGADSNGSESGSSYVVFGKASGFSAAMDLSTLNGSNGFRLDGDEAENRSGQSVSNAGDVNGDGFDDLIVGAYTADPNGYSSGSSYVVFGKASGFSAVMDLSSLHGNNGFRLDGDTVFGYSGRSVSTAGDVNSDGFDDLIVGAWGASPNGGYSGSSYVVFGKAAGFSAAMDLSSLDGSNGFRLDGVAGDDSSGISVSTAGDVNSDGFDDLIVGADGADPNGSRSGSSYVVFGKVSGFSAAMDLSSLDGSNGFRLDGVAADDSSGRSVSTAGDVNSDGFDDLIVGAWGASPDGRTYGSSYVVFGKAAGFSAAMDLSSLDGSNGFRLDGEAALDLSGYSVSNAEDVNGDGFDDVIVGARRAEPNGESSGSSYVVFGKASGFSAAMELSSLNGSNGFRLDGVTTGDYSGGSVSTAGDVNSDGFDDLIVGAFFADPNGENSGSSYVIFGRSSFVDDVDFQGTPGDDNFIGTKAAERFKGESGNDRMIGRGGADWFEGGAGNDYIRISGADFEFVDGGTGIDTLGLAGSNFNLNLSSVIDKIHGIETIGLYGIGDNSLNVTAQDVIDLSDSTNTLKVKGDTGDSVIGLSSGWTDGGVHGNFHTYTQGDAVLLVGVNVATDFA